MQCLPRLSTSLGAPARMSVSGKSSQIPCRLSRASSRAQSRTFHASPRRRHHPPSPAPGPSAGYAALSERRLVSLCGPDAAKFLQGATTRNMYDVPGTGGTYGAFLNAQGRVLNDVFVFLDTLGIGPKGGDPEESFLVDVDAAQAERLARHIKLYKLRANIKVRLLDPGEAMVWQAWWGDGGGGGGGGGDSCLRITDTRAPGMGTRFIAPLKNVPQPIVAGGLPEARESAYTIRRYLLGVPEGQAELLHDRALPQESNLDLMGGIDFRKGCYVGQELTIRTQHRGVVRKRILPVVVYGPHEEQPRRLEYRGDPELTSVPPSLCAENIPPETEIGRYQKSGRSAGKFLRGIGNVGLAVCRLEIMTDVQIPGAEGAGPVGGGFNPENEFVLRIDKDTTAPMEVKIKAFVPEWFRNKLAGSARRQE